MYTKKEIIKNDVAVKMDGSVNGWMKRRIMRC